MRVLGVSFTQNALVLGFCSTDMPGACLHQRPRTRINCCCQDSCMMPLAPRAQSSES